VAGGDRGRQDVRAEPRADLLGPRQRREATAGEQVVPPRAILVEEPRALPLATVFRR
jgi:hypothetical protein